MKFPQHPETPSQMPSGEWDLDYIDGEPMAVLVKDGTIRASMPAADFARMMDAALLRAIANRHTEKQREKAALVCKLTHWKQTAYLSRLEARRL